MANATTCYQCGAVTPLKCLNPNCSHYFCKAHGDFICATCHIQSAQQQVATVQKQEFRANATGTVLGILGAVLAGFVVLVIEIMKAIFKSL